MHVILITYYINKPFKPLMYGPKKCQNNIENMYIYWTINIPIDRLFFFRVLDRGFKLKNWHYHQSSHDEQVAVYSCKEFFQGFAFVAIIDFDEIIVNDRFSEYTQILMVTIRRK